MACVASDAREREGDACEREGDAREREGRGELKVPCVGSDAKALCCQVGVRVLRGIVDEGATYGAPCSTRLVNQPPPCKPEAHARLHCLPTTRSSPSLPLRDSTRRSCQADGKRLVNEADHGTPSD